MGTERLELIDFYAEWCEPCKILDEILGEVGLNLGKELKINKINIESYPDMSKKFGVSSVPVLVLLKGGKEVWRMNGFLTARELTEVFKKHL